MMPLLYPRWKAFTRTLSARSGQRHARIRVIITLLFMLAIFGFASHILSSIKEVRYTTAVPIVLIIAPLCFLLGMLALVSSLFCNIMYFFQAKDTEAIIASPISPESFCLQRLFLSAISTYWMVGIFALPIAAATAIHFHERLLAITACFLALLPSLLIPITCTYCLLLLLLSYLPMRFLSFTAKSIFYAGILWLFVKNLFASGSQQPSPSLALLQALDALAPAYSKINPTYWFAHHLANSYEAKPLNLPLALSLSCTAVGAILICLVLHELYYTKAYANYHSPQKAGSLNNFAQKTFEVLLTRASEDTSSIARYELLHYLRLPGQFFTLCIYSLIVLLAINECPHSTAIANGSWPEASEALSLLFVNITQWSICCAMMTRTSYTSPSIENEAAWVLASSPALPQTIMRAKFFLWRRIFFAGLLASSLFAFWRLGISISYYPLQALLCLLFCQINIAESLRHGIFNRSSEWDHLHQLTISSGAAVFSLRALLNTLLCVALGTILIFTHAIVASAMHYGSLLANLITIGIGLYLLKQNYKWQVWRIERVAQGNNFLNA
jgi:hypothetical protein